MRYLNMNRLIQATSGRETNSLLVHTVLSCEYSHVSE